MISVNIFRDNTQHKDDFGEIDMPLKAFRLRFFKFVFEGAPAVLPFRVTLLDKGLHLIPIMHHHCMMVHDGNSVFLKLYINIYSANSEHKHGCS